MRKYPHEISKVDIPLDFVEWTDVSRVCEVARAAGEILFTTGGVTLFAASLEVDPCLGGMMTWTKGVTLPSLLRFEGGRIGVVERFTGRAVMPIIVRRM